MSRKIYEIAKEVKNDWKKPYFGAVPYLEAMLGMSSINEMYGADEGKSIVVYFLSNASSYRGEVAKRIKQELKTIIQENK